MKIQIQGIRLNIQGSKAEILEQIYGLQSKAKFSRLLNTFSQIFEVDADIT